MFAVIVFAVPLADILIVSNTFNVVDAAVPVTVPEADVEDVPTVSTPVVSVLTRQPQQPFNIKVKILSVNFRFLNIY
jgi:hypothetical protein